MGDYRNHSRQHNHRRHALSFQEIPVDEQDPRFSRSFSAADAEHEAVRAFFEEFGFVIFRDVLSKQACQETIDDMMLLLQERNPGFDQRNPETWKIGLSHFGTPKGVNALFRPSLLRIRQNPLLLNAFGAITGTPDLVIGHDRWLLHRSPPREANGQVNPLTKRNLHLDMNPWEYQDEKAQKQVMDRLSNLCYAADDRVFISENNDVHKSMGRCVQGIVALSDIVSRDNGGTIIVPGFHKAFENWLPSADIKQKQVGPMQYKIDAKDRFIQSLAQHPTLRAGSLLIWDQRCLHGLTPNVSEKIRAAVPVRVFPRTLLDSRQAKERGAAVKHQIIKAGFEKELTDEGRRVFGIN